MSTFINIIYGVPFEVLDFEKLMSDWTDAEVLEFEHTMLTTDPAEGYRTYRYVEDNEGLSKTVFGIELGRVADDEDDLADKLCIMSVVSMQDEANFEELKSKIISRSDIGNAVASLLENKEPRLFFTPGTL